MKYRAIPEYYDAEYEHQMMEALWVHQHHNVVDTALLERMLSSPDFRARADAAEGVKPIRIGMMQDAVVAV